MISEAPPWMRMLQTLWSEIHSSSFRVNLVEYILYAALFLFAAAPAFYLGWNNVGTFTSPDENSRYMTAQMFAENGRLYYQDPVTRLNPDPPTGPRYFVQHNGRSVTIYPLGHPFVVGIAHRLFAQAAPIALSIVPGLLVLSLALLVRVLLPAAPRYLGFIFLGVTPLWYWPSRMYMDLGLAFMFVGVGLLCFAVAHKCRSVVWFFVASSMFGLAALMRHQEAPLLLILGGVMIIAFIRQLDLFQWNYALRVVGAYAVAQLLWFLIPMGLLNWWTYGSPMTLGYVLFTRQEFPDQLPAVSNMVLSFGRFLWLALFPSQIDIATMLRALFYQVFLTIPLILALGMAGLFFARKSLTTTFGYGGFAVLALSLAYVLVSRADAGIFEATITEPSLRASIVRYWLPVYIALGIGAAVTLSRTPNFISISVIIGILVGSAYQVWTAQPESIRDLQSTIDKNSSRYKSFLEAYTERNALIFTAGTMDKFTAPVRRTAQTASNLEPTSVAATTGSYFDIGTPVYYLFQTGYQDIIDSLRLSLELELLDVELAASSTFADLWRVVSISNRMSAELVSPTSIMVTWSHQSHKWSKFQLERREEIKGPWEKIATLDRETLSYLDEGLGTRKSFYYRISQVNSPGKASNWALTAGVRTGAK